MVLLRLIRLWCLLALLSLALKIQDGRALKQELNGEGNCSVERDCRSQLMIGS